MKLVNNTPIPAKLTVSEIYGMKDRFGMIVAKATYKFDNQGNVEIDTQEPFSLFADDEKTDLGLLPRDDFPRKDSVFEVILLGSAFAPRGKFTESMTVSLTVGKHKRKLFVFGDRQWIRESISKGKALISKPKPFTSMPLTYERAFGGSCEVFLDKDSPVTVTDPINRLGRGFDFESIAKGISEQFYTAKGYPIFDKTRWLPNVEHPDQLIKKWDDVPTPACWATVPMDTGIHAKRSMDISKININQDDPLGSDFPKSLPLTEGAFHRASPEWIIDVPENGAQVILEGLTPEGIIKFVLPSLRIFVDYVVGERNGVRELAPQMLVLLPDEKRFYVVHRHLLNVNYQPGIERSMRLRFQEN